MHHSHHADLLESFTNPTHSHLHPEDIYIPPHLQPVNPEDEDDVVPDQHAAFGIQRATQHKKEIQWRDLGLDELMRRGPGEGTRANLGGRSAGGPAMGVGGGMPRGVEEPVVVALRRRPGHERLGLVMAEVGTDMRARGQGGAAAGNGLPR
ncbi:Apc13p protein-domain-containing protein [Dendryphion nanum]|uniref:Apc13p protein-domain-containing protein n=1 Tax=Dendryphion nanum TaxID=256645 RepID=A0A9P9D794_9PLEO|nr:Apc13p protein-domain-containing protein [Dendryphion nanum]